MKNHVKVNILALGDVGAALLLGLKLLGGDLIDTIGIYDVNKNVAMRYEAEMNQIGWAFGDVRLPQVKILAEDELFQCDMFVFCASKAVPPLEATGDVRLMQLEANSKILSHYAKLASEADFNGIFAVVSDPVDQLCKVALTESNLKASQIRGYGLGVMNKRAEYFAYKDERFKSYLTEGRAFGPHGKGLVIANSIVNYDDQLSRELTQLTINANMKVRELGFKPYIAPAISSGAMSIIDTLKGNWHYSSIYFGDEHKGAFFGIKNRIKDGEVELEDIELPEELYYRIKKSYENLCK